MGRGKLNGQYRRAVAFGLKWFRGKVNTPHRPLRPASEVCFSSVFSENVGAVVEGGVVKKRIQ